MTRNTKKFSPSYVVQTAWYIFVVCIKSYHTLWQRYIVIRMRQNEGGGVVVMMGWGMGGGGLPHCSYQLHGAYGLIEGGRHCSLHKIKINLTAESSNN